MRFRRNPLGSFTELARTYGDVASVKLGPVRIVLLSHPDHIRDVLVTRAAEFSKAPPCSGPSACWARAC